MTIKSKNEVVQALKGALFKFKMINPELIAGDKNVTEFIKRIDAIMNDEVIQWIARHPEEKVVLPDDTLDAKKLKRSLGIARSQRRQALQRVMEADCDKQQLAETVSEWDHIIANIEYKLETLV